MREKPRVLCVDDQLEALLPMKCLLEIHGFEVVPAISGLEALEIVQNSESFFMVLSDYDMPHMKGTELLRKIREYCPQAVRILISGGLVQQEAEAFIRNGDFELFIAKPWDSSKVISIIYEELKLVEGHTMLDHIHI